MRIVVEKVNEVFIRVFSEDSTEREISDYFTFSVPGAQFTPAFKARLWDGKIRLYDFQRKTLYAGLYKHLLAFAEKNGYTVSIAKESQDFLLDESKFIQRDTLEKYIDALNPHSRGEKISARSYQVDAIMEAINKERTLLLSPTASGKSFIIYNIMQYHLAKGNKCIIIVPSTSLVEQLYSDFADYSSAIKWDVSKQCQKLYSGFTKEIKANVLITTWQSIYKQPKAWFDQFDVLFGDEAHQFKAKSLTTTMEKMTEIRYRIGTTGTLDGKAVNKLVLEGLFGPVYKVTSTRELMDEDSLAKLKIRCISFKYSEETKKLTKKMTYQQEMDFLVSHEKRNKFIKNLAVKSEGNTLVLFQYVEKHGKELYGQIKQQVGDGRHVFFVYGGVGTDEREKIRHIVEKENNAIIIASYGTFSTGINIPSIENIIFASPSKSKVRNLQSIGRGLRLKNGKKECVLYDLSDDLCHKSHKNHTFNHFVERTKIYSEENFEFDILGVNLE